MGSSGLQVGHTTPAGNPTRAAPLACHQSYKIIHVYRRRQELPEAQWLKKQQHVDSIEKSSCILLVISEFLSGFPRNKSSSFVLVMTGPPGCGVLITPSLCKWAVTFTFPFRPLSLPQQMRRDFWHLSLFRKHEELGALVGGACV